MRKIVLLFILFMITTGIAGTVIAKKTMMDVKNKPPGTEIQTIQIFQGNKQTGEYKLIEIKDNGQTRFELYALYKDGNYKKPMRGLVGQPKATSREALSKEMSSRLPGLISKIQGDQVTVSDGEGNIIASDSKSNINKNQLKKVSENIALASASGQKGTGIKTNVASKKCCLKPPCV